MYIGGLAFVTAGFFEPAARPGLAFWFLLACVLATGLLSGSWWVVPLGLLAAVSAGRIGNDEVDVVMIPAAALLAVVALAIVVLVRRRTSGTWVVRAGIGALGAAVVIASWGAFRQLDPLDVMPSKPLLVNVSIGKAGHIWLGDSLALARRGLGPRSEGEAPFAGNVGYAVFGDVTLWYEESGIVAIVDTSDPRYQTTEGVGIGDSLAHARRVYPGLTCLEVSSGSEECAGRDGNRILILSGNPISSLTLSSYLCYPNIDGYDFDDDDCLQSRSFLYTRT